MARELGSSPRRNSRRFFMIFARTSISVRRIINQTRLDALIQEQERLIVEEHLEEVQQQKQELEERVVEVTLSAENEHKDASCTEDPVVGDVTDQEKEEKPYDVTVDDDTRVKDERPMFRENTVSWEESFG